MAPCRIGGLERTSGAGNLMQSHLVIWLHSDKGYTPCCSQDTPVLSVGRPGKARSFRWSGKFCPGRMELVLLLLLWSGHSLLIQLEQHFSVRHCPEIAMRCQDTLIVPNPQIGLPGSKCTHCHTWHTPPLPFFALIVAPSQYLITVDMLCISLVCLFSAWLSPVPRTASASAGTGFSQHP